MPDLVTHLASALIPGVALRPDRAVLLALGTAIPDLAGRVPGLGLVLLRRTLLPQLGALEVPFGVLHQPVGASLVAGILAYALPQEDRPAALGLLMTGIALHLALDLLQDHRGYGYALLFPLSSSRFEIGIIGPEATVPYAPLLVALTLILWGGRWWLRRSRARRHG